MPTADESREEPPCSVVTCLGLKFWVRLKTCELGSKASNVTIGKIGWTFFDADPPGGDT